MTGTTNVQKTKTNYHGTPPPRPAPVQPKAPSVSTPAIKTVTGKSPKGAQ